MTSPPQKGICGLQPIQHATLELLMAVVCRMNNMHVKMNMHMHYACDLCAVLRCAVMYSTHNIMYTIGQQYAACKSTIYYVGISECAALQEKHAVQEVVQFVCLFVMCMMFCY